MNTVRRLRPARASALRDRFRTCLFLGMLLLNLACVLAITLRAPDAHQAALGAVALTMLLATLP